MPSAVTVDPTLAATLDQVLVGLLPASALPDAEVFLDEEGAPIARRDGDAVIAARELRWSRPQDVAHRGPVAVATPGAVPADRVPGEVLVLLAAGGVRPDDHRHATWAAAWQQAAGSVVAVPVAPDDVDRRRTDLATAYGDGTTVDVRTAPLPVGTGRVLFFTGLSGSGKSTVARAVVERLAGTRSVTLLDGDVVRTHLSKGLGFSREDRDVNIRRIGWVAAEVAKHGGVAVCAPIAPYDVTRRWVRDTVEAAAGPGAFRLVWISTSLEVCEQRDVKGLYAKARAGEIRGFTGIDDPYEEPADADLAIDTSQVPLDDAVSQVLALL